MTPQERKFWVQSMGARPEWWALRNEAVIEPDREVVDTHCHLWPARTVRDPQDANLTMETSPYLLDQLHADTNDGHKVSQIVYIECGSGYYDGGPEYLRPVGETEFAADLARQSAARKDATEIAAIVGFADLRNPNLDQVLDAHQAKGDGRFRGVRHSVARLENPAARLLAAAAPPNLSADPDFRRGVARLGGRGLVFESFQFHFQLEQLCDLAIAAPDTAIIVNHLGTPVGFAHLPAHQDPVFSTWAKQIEILAKLPNVMMKLGGLASVVTEYDGGTRDIPPSSQDFVDERGAYFHHAIENFGADRCMFESNFPVDSTSISYRSLWNAYKIIALEYDRAAQDALLAGTARRIYSI